MTKKAQPIYPIHELIANRWSPYCYEPRVVERDKLATCLEAASWAASSYNEQPWTYIVATRDDQPEFSRMLSCLLEANQFWAQHAGVLMLGVVATAFSRNGRPNRVAQHDLGLASGNLSLQATALGLSVHQMGGFDLEKARQVYGIPETHVPVTAIAIGYAADPAPAILNWPIEIERRELGSHSRSSSIEVNGVRRLWSTDSVDSHIRTPEPADAWSDRHHRRRGSVQGSICRSIRFHFGGQGTPRTDLLQVLCREGSITIGQVK